jgi:methylglutaconyl-CoA hydratase
MLHSQACASRAASVGVVGVTQRGFATTGNYDFLRVEEKQYGSHWITLSRPRLHNAFNQQLMEEVHDAFESVPGHARSVVLTGEGRSFSAGADLNYMQSMAQHSESQNAVDSQKLFDMFLSIKRCPAPVIARINGACIAGGTGLASACDMGFAVESARFALTEAKIGLIPAVISKFVMDKIGKNNASRYFLTAELFDAQEALRIGLLHGVGEDLDAVDAQIDAVLLALGRNGPSAVRAAKQLVEDAATYSLIEDTRDTMTKRIAKIRVSPEGQEGIQSFLEKRAPDWVLHE